MPSLVTFVFTQKSVNGKIILLWFTICTKSYICGSSNFFECGKLFHLCVVISKGVIFYWSLLFRVTLSQILSRMSFYQWRSCWNMLKFLYILFVYFLCFHKRLFWRGIHFVQIVDLQYVSEKANIEPTNEINSIFKGNNKNKTLIGKCFLSSFCDLVNPI